MKLLFDQNISFRIIKKLSDSFYDSRHVSIEGLTNASDLEIWKHAKDNDFTIVSQDSVFVEIEEFYIDVSLGCFEIFKFD